MMMADMDPRLLENRVALVTGGAQGIGAGLCEGLARAGASVAIVDIQHDKATALADLLRSSGLAAHAIGADLRTAEACQAAVTEALAVFGRLDILVNNAAPARDRQMLGRVANADWEAHEALVLQAAVNLVEAALPALSREGTGSVLNVSSVISWRVAPDQCAWPYHVSKAGLNQLTRWLACRLGPHNVRVNAVAPGLVDRESGVRISDSPANRSIIEAVVPLRRAGRAADIARAAVFLCSDQASYITGQVLVVDGGIDLGDVFGASLRAFRLGASHVPDTP